MKNLPIHHAARSTIVSATFLGALAVAGAAHAQVSPVSGSGETVLFSDGATVQNSSDQVRNLTYTMTDINEITVTYEWLAADTGFYSQNYGIHTKLFFYDGTAWTEIYSNRIVAPATAPLLDTWQPETIVYNIPEAAEDGTKYIRASIIDLASTSDTMNTSFGCGSCGVVGASDRHFDNADVSFTYTGDTTPPELTTASISSDNDDTARATVGDTVTLSLVFDEDLAVAPTVTLLGQSVTASGSGTNWTATAVVAPTSAEGPVSFTVSGYEDAVGNVGTDVTATTDATAVVVDSTNPALTISGVPTEFSAGDIFTVTFDFGEAVSGFSADDITVTGATLGALTGGPSVYSVEITPDASADVSVSVASAAATDLTGNPSAAAAVSSDLLSAEAASEEIAEFMLNRARNLIQNQPRLIGLMNGVVDGAFNASVSRSGGMDLSFGSRMDSPVWAALQGSRTVHSNEAETTFALASFGSHMNLDANTLVGAMLQFDYAENTDESGAEIRGQGFLGGPYIVGQIGDQPLYYEARALWGKSENEVTPLGTFTDEFETERFLLLAALEGEQMWNDIRVMPRFQLTHVKETQLAYTDALSNAVAEQSIALTEVAASARFEKPLPLSGGEHILTWAGTATWSEQDADGASTAFIEDYNGGRARLDVGYRFMGDDVSFTSDVYVDGLGTDAFKSYGMQLAVAFQF